MKRILITLATLLLLAPVAAQVDSQALARLMRINEQMKIAGELSKGKDYLQTAEAYLALSDLLKDYQDEQERELYVIARLSAAHNYHMDRQHEEEAFQLADALMKEEHLTEKERRRAQSTYAACGLSLGMKLMNREVKQYERARELFGLITPYASDKLMGFVKRNLPMAWQFEGIDRLLAFDLEAAYNCFEQASKGYLANGDTTDVVKMYEQMATCRRYMCDYTSALRIHDQAYDVAASADNHALMMDMRLEQRAIFRALCDRRSMALVDEEIDRLVSSDETLLVAYYTWLGDDAKEMGNTSLSESYYLKTIQLNPQTTQSERTGVVLVYNSLRDAMEKAGEYDKALGYEEQRYALAKQSNYRYTDYDHYYYLSNLYCDAARYEEALACADSALSALENLEGTTEQMSHAYISRAMALSAMERYADALADLDRAYAVMAGADTPQAQDDRMDIVGIRSGIQNRVGDYAASEEGYRQYYEWKRSVFGDESVDACEALSYLANAEAFNGHTASGKDHYIRAVTTLMQLIRERLRYVSSTERESFWKSVSGLLWEMTGFGLKAEAVSDEFTEAAYNALLFSKSLLLSSETSMYEMLQSDGSADDLADFSAIAAMQALMSELSRDADANRDEIARLGAERLSLDRQLSLRSAAYRDYTSFLDIKYRDVRSALEPTDVVIDFTDYVLQSGVHTYAAYVVSRDAEHPRLLRSFNEAELDSLLDDRHLSLLYRSDVGPGVVDLLWEPLSRYVSPGARVCYIPSGILHQVALESLPMADGSLLGDHYRFVRLSSAREVLRLDDVMAMKDDDTAALFGGLTYEATDEQMLSESGKHQVSPVLSETVYQRGSYNDMSFFELQYSLEEVETVAQVLRDQNMAVDLFTRSSGTEEAFLAMSGHSPAILLLSTHGFFYAPHQADHIAFLRGYTDAMSLTGLIMSGGNRAWRGETLPKGVLGGVLTAGRIALTDLAQTRLTVLSACQTGQGQATPEGVYGLQRAFKKAGVQSLVKSLWNVNDNSARDFMTTFFRQLATNGWQLRQAFEETKRLIRLQYPDPRDWAAFVLLD